MPDNFKFLPNKESNPEHSPLRPHTPSPHPDTFIDHKSHAKPGIWAFPDKLHVCTAIINPQRFRSRYELFRGFEHRVDTGSAILHVAEVAFGGRHFEVTDPNNPNHLQLRIHNHVHNQELWHKENALNLLIADVIRRHPEAGYFAWIDADVQFSRPDWAQETLHQLQHYHVVQMWSMCQDLNADHEMLGYEDGGETLPGMVHQYISHHTRYGSNVAFLKSLKLRAEKPESKFDPYYGGAMKVPGMDKRLHPGHSGYAWAATRHAIDVLGGLIDWSPCGANDHHMARAFIGNILDSVHPHSPAPFKESLRIWGERAETLKPKIGYVPGMITHFWHGPKANRRYLDRWQIINDNQFDPALDLKRDAQGLYQLTWRNKKLVEDLMAYFRQRNEDSTGV
jgi:hypothetical protein